MNFQLLDFLLGHIEKHHKLLVDPQQMGQRLEVCVLMEEQFLQSNKESIPTKFFVALYRPRVLVVQKRL
jgi:hypothetical protein